MRRFLVPISLLALSGLAAPAAAVVGTPLAPTQYDVSGLIQTDLVIANSNALSGPAPLSLGIGRGIDNISASYTASAQGGRSPSVRATASVSRGDGGPFAGGRAVGAANVTYRMRINGPGDSAPVAVLGQMSLATSIDPGENRRSPQSSARVSVAAQINGPGLPFRTLFGAGGTADRCCTSGFLTIDNVTTQRPGPSLPLMPVAFSLWLPTGADLTVRLSASAEASSTGPLGSATAFLDPVFSIDPGLADPAAYSFSFSPGLATGAVPEPASWALLIAGFGLVGAMQRRQAAVSASRVTSSSACRSYGSLGVWLVTMQTVVEPILGQLVQKSQHS